MEYKLGDICILFTDGDWIESKDQASSGIRLLQTGNIGEGIYQDKGNRKKYITSETFVKLRCTEVLPGDILVSRLPEPVGRSCIIPNLDEEKMITAVDCSICRVDEEIVTKKYLCYFMRSSMYYRQLHFAISGTTRKRISRKNLGNIKVFIPHRNEQDNVVAILDFLEKISGYRKKQLNDLDDLIKSRFVEMFGDPKTNNKNMSTLDFINVVKLQRGYDLPIQQRDLNGCVPVYGSNGKLGFHSEAKISAGVITGRSGTVGKVYYDEGDFWPLNTTLFSIETYGNNVVFLSYLLELFELQRFVEGSGVPTLNRNIVHKAKIINAPFYLQNQFADFVKQVDKSKFETV